MVHEVAGQTTSADGKGLQTYGGTAQRPAAPYLPALAMLTQILSGVKGELRQDYCHAD